jgi:Tfp pilus assembly protein PilF
MASTDTSDSPSPEPRLSPSEREEVRCLDFLLAELRNHHLRGLIPETSYATVEKETRERRQAIVHRGQARASLDAARRLASTDPGAALVQAERARELDPSVIDAWVKAIRLHQTLGALDQARIPWPSLDSSKPDGAVTGLATYYGCFLREVPNQNP